MTQQWSPARLEDRLELWGLRLDGDVVATPSSRLAPVRTADGVPAMLKVPRVEEEARGGSVLSWFAARGAPVAPVLAVDDRAVLMARADGRRDLARMSREGRDDEAVRVLVETAATLHTASAADGPTSSTASVSGAIGPVPLPAWFRELLAHAGGPGLLGRSAAIASELLAGPADEVVLHGDVHHGNVLDFAGLGWRAIDPKGLVGCRVFDLANVFCNPDPVFALDRFERRVDLVREAAGVERDVLLSWIVAWTGLSVSWDPSTTWAAGVARVGERALELLGGPPRG